MAEKPILIFPMVTVATRQTLPPAIRQPHPRPTQSEQARRLATRFDALSRQFGAVQPDSTGVDPEKVVVFEVVGSISDFQNVVKRIHGMEWLGDFSTELSSPDPGFLADGSDATQEPGRLFVVMSNRAASNELLRLWRVWTQARNEKLPWGYGPLAEVFKHLQDVRLWGPKDRVQETGVVPFWEESLASNQPTIRFEAELWCRSAVAARDQAFTRLQTVVNAAGGQCIKRATICEIEYDGVLLELPANTIRSALGALRVGRETALLRIVDVKYYTPMGQASVLPMADGSPMAIGGKPLPDGEAIAALFDGLPLTNHAMLQNRLVIDDPDDFAAKYQVGEHRHGTAMASLVIHGEIDADEPAINSKLYVRPLMYPARPAPNGIRNEMFSSDELTVDLVHRAVRRLFERDADQTPKAPRVKIINLSVGDNTQRFDRKISPWARLLDWLAWQYRVLFIVSAGNHPDDLRLPVQPNAVSGLSDADLRAHTIRAMAQQRVQRRLLAPAESVNALTVGALHAQSSRPAPSGRAVDLLRGAALPSPFSTVTSGFRHAVKPEILVPGGMLHYAPKRAVPQPEAEFETIQSMNQPGQLVAADGGLAIPPNHAVRLCGTSNAAALTTRRAIQCIEQISQLREGVGGEALADSRTAAILKAMLVHGASWADHASFFDQVFDGQDSGIERWWRIKRACAQFLGYGVADFERGTVCTDQRVILLGCSELRADQGHVYNVPLPPALNAQTIRRRLTITLAWLTPVNPRHRNYCRADLWFDPPDTQLQVSRKDVEHTMVKQGTVQHEVLEGDGAVPIAEGDSLPIQVNCRADASMKLKEAIPYALFVTLETGAPLAVSLYEQVKVALARIREVARVRPAVRAAQS